MSQMLVLSQNWEEDVPECSGREISQIFFIKFQFPGNGIRECRPLVIGQILKAYPTIALQYRQLHYSTKKVQVRGISGGAFSIRHLQPLQSKCNVLFLLHIFFQRYFLNPIIFYVKQKILINTCYSGIPTGHRFFKNKMRGQFAFMLTL